MTKLLPFQREGVRRIYGFRGRALLADEQGCGKTIQALSWVLKTPSHRPVVIVTPAVAKWTWHAEASLHFGMRTEVLEGRRPKRLMTLPGEVVVINYDILHSWLPCLLRHRPATVILDEVHWIKNLTARRTRSVIQLAAGARSVLGLSGTPLTNRPFELWPILHVIKPGLFPERGGYAWRYCKPRYTPWGWKYDGAQRLGELHRLLTEHVMIRRLKKEVLPELPDKTRKLVVFRLADYREYQEAETDFLRWLKRISPLKAARAKKSQALTRVGYLLRLAARLKLGWTVRWIEEFFTDHPGEKLVALTMNTFVIDHLRKHFPKSVIIDGRVTGRKREESKRRFQTSKHINLLLGNWKAAGVSLTLTAARSAVALDFPWTPGDLVQGEDRVHRIGQKRDVVVYYLALLNTIEEKLIRILHKKSGVLDAVLNGTASTKDLDIFDELLRVARKS